MMRSLAVALVLAGVLACAGCGEMAPPLTAASTTAPAAADAHERGRAIYNFRCYFCHGYSGDAKTVAATYLEPPPRDFTAAAASALTAAEVHEIVRHGRAGTAMASFAGILGDDEMRLVADFVVAEFVRARAPNTRYHTAENGWPEHAKTRDAWPFATGAIAIDAPSDTLDAAQAAGQRLFLSACVSCHDRGRDAPSGPAFDTRPVSYPPDGHDCVSCHDRSRFPERGLAATHKPISYHGRSVTPEVARATADAAASDPYGAHDIPLTIADLTPRERLGERVYLSNCAFCHAADGTARNWIGRFLDPHPRDLTDLAAMQGMTRARLAQRIREGLPGTSMPAWRNVLSAHEIDALVAYIARAFGTVGDASPPSASTLR